MLSRITSRTQANVLTAWIREMMECTEYILQIFQAVNKGTTGPRGSNVNSLIMCFDTESIDTNFPVIDEHQDDQTSGSPEEPLIKTNRFESQFMFPPIAQIEDIDLSDEDSF